MSKSLVLALCLLPLSSGMYLGETGSSFVNILSDNCWDNVSFTGMQGKKALIVTTSYGEPLSNGDQTGVTLEEATAPYYVYLDAGFDVQIASIKGGPVPYSTSDPQTPSVKRFLGDPEAMEKLNTSESVVNVAAAFAGYDVVFMAGGWGAAFDLGYSPDLGERVAGALQAEYPLIGSTCHGALGFVMANKTDGTPWVAGRTVTAVSDDQIARLGITDQTPMHPEDEMRKLGALYEKISGSSLALGDIGATSTSCDSSGPVIFTGQNQNSACVAAQRQLEYIQSS